MLARRIAVYSVIVMLGALWGGAYVLNFFGVSIAALRIAGGFVVASSAWVLLQRPEQNEDKKQEQASHATGEDDVAFFPLTMPFTTGPGTIAVAIAIGSNLPVGKPGFLAVLPRRIGGGGRDRRDGSGRLQLGRPHRGVARPGAGARGDAARGVPAALRRRADHAERDRGFCRRDLRRLRLRRGAARRRFHLTAKPLSALLAIVDARGDNVDRGRSVGIIDEAPGSNNPGRRRSSNNRAVRASHRKRTGRGQPPAPNAPPKPPCL